MIRVRALAVGLAAVTATGSLAAVGWRAGAGPLTPQAQIDAVVHQPLYAHSRWGYLARDLDDGGRRLFGSNARQFFVPGSNAKLLSVSGAWDALGADHHFRTPVYRQGRQVGGTVHGDLVLVGAGDLVMGGRGGTGPHRRIAFTNFDHNDANAVPGVATLTPQDPLAGIKRLARRVVRSGVHRVTGDVVVDDRLFQTDRVQNPASPVHTVFLNENVIDTVSTPTTVGHLARFDYRPKTSAIRVTSRVRTAAAGTAIDLRTTEVAPGRVVLSGSVPVDAKVPVVYTYEVPDPPAFVRAAFIDALRARHVRVDAPRAGPNPERLLPARRSYAARDRVAVFVSPVFSEYAKLIMKVSLNVGANLMVCLQAVQVGSTDCLDGLAPMRRFLQRAGVPVAELAIGDGQGGSPTDWVTPRAVVDLLDWWADQPDFRRFRAALPILGRDGSLATVLPTSPAAGKVFAKTGTLVGGDPLNDRLILLTKALAGYARGRSGHLVAFSVYVNNAGLPGLDGVFTANDDVGQAAAIIQQNS